MHVKFYATQILFNIWYLDSSFMHNFYIKENLKVKNIIYEISNHFEIQQLWMIYKENDRWSSQNSYPS